MPGRQVLSLKFCANQCGRTMVQPAPEALTYLTAWRMTLGADLLRDSSATVAAVGRAVGYDDPFAFSVAFKRHRGVAPSDWRRSPVL